MTYRDAIRHELFFPMLVELSIIGRPVLRKVAGDNSEWIIDVWLPPTEKHSVTGTGASPEEAVASAYNKVKNDCA